MSTIPSAPFQIAILDDYLDISRAHFSTLPSSQFVITAFPDTLPPFSHASTSPEVQSELIERLKPFHIISSMRERTPFPRALLEKLPNLKLLLTTGLRNRGIDLDAARELGILVTGAPGMTAYRSAGGSGPDSTTQHTVALILGIVRGIADNDNRVKQGGWQAHTAIGLPGKVFATMGLGRLGGAVARIMYTAFRMRIICWSNSLTQDTADARAAELGLPVEDQYGKVFRAVGKEELLREADVLSVHYVLSERSRGIIGREDLEKMKKSAFLVNTSRGPLVDEDALLDVLGRGAIAGAALDCFDLEPLKSESRWRRTDWGRDGKSLVLLSPHMGYVEEETLNAWYTEQVEVVTKWVSGQELNWVMS